MRRKRSSALCFASLGVVLSGAVVGFCCMPECISSRGPSCGRRGTPIQGRSALAASGKGVVYVCTGSSCKNDGAGGCLQMLRRLAPDNVQVKETGCLGPCSSGPNVLATPRPASDPMGGKGRDSRSVGGMQQPAGVCFTGIKTEEDAALLSPWGFKVDGSSNPLSALRLLVRSTGADQVPWPILLYVGFNVIRLPINVFFHVDLLQLISQAVKPPA
mmetsp:Transcript_12982/g.30869  ORF Transcript_12982/g.30869 Transcript_12982/m.30869 type:complete len:216 (-) Transcript_12982:127-774(-)